MTREVSFRAWRCADLADGTHLGTRAGPSGLTLERPVGRRRYADPHAPAGDGPRDYEWAAWVSPVVSTPHPFASLVPSWNARTPGDGWLEVEVRVRAGGGWSGWYSLGCWAEDDHEVRPTTRAGQDDGVASVRHDVLTSAAGTTWWGYQLRAVLHRGVGGAATPSLSLLAAVVSGPDRGHGSAWRDLGHGSAGPVEGPRAGPARGVELPVPAYSQHLHDGAYPQWNGGGESWCSPTSTSMVLQYWGLGPGETEYAWVQAGSPDRFVPHAARHVFDHGYSGAGNWSFNVAYAGRFGAEAFVTRLRSLDEAERFLAAGIPLVASLAFEDGALDGAGYGTNGHLLAIVGFDSSGAVVCNDPASRRRPSNDFVRVVFDRHQFERAWQDRSGGLVYVVRPGEVPLPAHVPGLPANW